MTARPESHTPKRKPSGRRATDLLLRSLHPIDPLLRPASDHVSGAAKHRPGGGAPRNMATTRRDEGPLISLASPSHLPLISLASPSHLPRISLVRVAGCLQGLPAQALVTGASDASAAACGGRACMQPTIDGVELSDEPRLLLPLTNLSAVSLLMGAGIDEGDGFDAGGHSSL